MTEDELLMIKEHIEIHARREPRAIKITQILWKAVEELEATKELQEELEKWKAEWQEQVQKATDEGYARTQLQIENGKLKEQIEKAKNLLQKVADVCGYPNYDIPVELYSEIADFLKDSEVEK